VGPIVLVNVITMLVEVYLRKLVPVLVIVKADVIVFTNKAVALLTTDLTTVRGISDIPFHLQLQNLHTSHRQVGG
jgi:hypothetical protein